MQLGLMHSVVSILILFDSIECRTSFYKFQLLVPVWKLYITVTYHLHFGNIHFSLLLVLGSVHVKTNECLKKIQSRLCKQTTLW